MPTHSMIKIYGPQMNTDVRALIILRRNIRELLMRRKESETVLAQYLGFKSRSSVNKFLNNARAGFHMERLDRLAAFFGLPVYQLFQPGISALTERRHSGERRSGRDRRIGHSDRLMLQAGANIAEVRQRMSGGGAGDGSRLVSAQTASLRQLIAEMERRLADILETPDAGRQTTRASETEPKTRARRRTAGGPDSEKAS